MSTADETPIDAETDPTGRRCEHLALLAAAALTLAGFGIAAVAAMRPGRMAAEALQPPADHERFIVHINDDDWPTIALLPRIGPALARRIMTYRARHGRFAALDDLTNVKGIGPKTLDQLRPHVRLDPRPAAPARREPAHPED